MQLLKIVCNHFVLFQEFKTWQEIKTKFSDLKQNKKEYTYIKQNQCPHFCYISYYSLK